MEKKQKDYENEIFTIPNCITISRILASVGLFSYMLISGITLAPGLAIGAGLIAGTDFVDGYIARRYNMTSKVGRVLDPIADKMFNWGLCLTLMAIGTIPVWPLLIGVRDLSVASLSYYQLKKNDKVLAPTMPAKIKMWFQSIGVVSTLTFGFGTEGLGLIAPIAMASAVATVIPEAICIKKKYFNTKKDVPDTINTSTVELSKEDSSNDLESEISYQYNINENTQFEKPRQKVKTYNKKD